MESTHQQQANDFLQKTNTKIDIEYLKYDYHFIGDKDERDIYKVTIKRDSRQFSLNFGQSLARSRRKEAPTNYDILACLTKNEVGTFDDFCGNYGYSNDSKTARKIYKAVVKEWENVCLIWSDDEIELLQEIW